MSFVIMFVTSQLPIQTTKIFHSFFDVASNLKKIPPPLWCQTITADTRFTQDLVTLKY